MRQTLRDGPPVRRGMHPNLAAEFRPSSDDFDGKVSQESDITRKRTLSQDLEKQSQDTRRVSSHGQKDDPFGDEGDSEVKYQTLRWYVYGPYSFLNATNTT
jgi:hypothetical protein